MMEPLEQAAKLLALVNKRRPQLDRLDCYYAGQHDPPFGSPTADDAYRVFVRKARANWCALVVDAVSERLRVDGFRMGDGATSADDDDAWAVWQENHLDAMHGMVHTDALVFSRGVVSVGQDTDGEVVILPEDPRSTVVLYEPSPLRRRRVAALKVWRPQDQTGVLAGPLEAFMWTPDATYHLASEKGWKIVESTPNDWGVVPVVEFIANPRTDGSGRSEMADVMDIQDRINETIFARMIATQYAAFRQKWVTGLGIDYDPDTGQPLEPFKHAIDRLWVAEDPETKFGEFGEANLSNYLSSIEDDIAHLAAISKTPPYYLMGRMANISAEALKASEAGLVAKARRHQLFFGEAWEEVMRLALTMRGSNRASDEATEVVWSDPESRSDAQTIDGLVKLKSIGVPDEALWARVPGASMQEVARWRATATRNAFLSTTPTVVGSATAAQPPAVPDMTPAASTDAGSPSL